MKLLLPRSFKWIGIILLIPSIILGILCTYFEFSFAFLNLPHRTANPNTNTFDFGDYNLTNEFALTGIIVGLLMIAFSREKNEDEFISRLRLESLQSAVLINYLLLLAGTWFVNGIAFLNVMLYNMLTVLIIFIIWFHVVLIKAKRNMNV